MNASTLPSNSYKVLTLRKVFLLALLLLVSGISYGQNITRFEYFIDTDPGVGLATSVNVTPGTSFVDFNIPVSTSALSPGFHTLYIRSQNELGNWTHTHYRTFFVDNSIVPPTISSFNPSSGLVGSTVIITGTNFSTVPANNTVRFNGVAATVTNATSTSLTVTVPSGATSGLISVVVAGLTATSSSAFTVQSPNLTALEYFFNTDPGPGNGIPLTITPGTTIDLTNINIATTSLAVGWHTLHVRARDANNVWGFYESRQIYVRGPATPDPPVTVHDITQAEFFYDMDNGPGTGTAIPITAGQTIDLVNTNLANSLPLGWHTVHVRTKNANNVWGFYESRQIFVRGMPDPPDPPPSPIVELEWFVDADPGAGLSTTKKTISPSQTNIDLIDEPLDVGVQTLGAHKIYIRAKNQDGEWSMNEAADFTVITPCSIITAPSATGLTRCDAGPVTLTATGASAGETYRWYTDASANTPLFTGNPYVTASLSVNTTFHVSKYNSTTFCESARTPVTATISGIEKPVLNVTGSLSVCEGTSQVLTAPTGFTTYAWSNGSTTQQITVTASGSYSVVVNNGVCSSPPSDAFIFTVNAKPLKPTITSTSGGSLCGTGSVTLSAPAGFSSYAWSSGQTTPDIAVSSAGNFTVIVTNAAGCQSVPSDIFTVTNTPPANPTITVTGSTILCGSSTVELTAPTGFGSYLWSNGETTQSITTGTAGSYTVTVSNGGCTSLPSDAVVITTVSAPAKPTIAITGNTTLCNGAFTVLSAPTGFSNYIWSSGETTRQIVVTAAGTFSVQTGTAATCLSPVSDNVVIAVNGLPCSGTTPPGAPTVTNSSRCGDGSVTLTATGATTGQEYRWYDAATGGSLLANSNTYPTLMLTQTTDFYAAIYDPLTLLESSRVKATATIIQFSKPVLSPAGSASLCAGANLLVEAPTGFAVYQWRRNGTIISGINSQQIFVTDAGNYTVETGDGTCFSEASDNLAIAVETAPSKPTITGSNTVCGTGTVTLTASGTGPYLWSTTPSQSTKTITVGVGTYSVTVSNGSCFTTSDAFIVNAVTIPTKPVIAIIGKEVVCVGSVVALSAPAGFSHYLWSNGSTTQGLVVTEPGVYSVQTGNAADCLSEASDEVEVKAGTLAECGLVQTPDNDAPEIEAVSFGVQIQSEASYALTPYISDEEDNLDITTLRIIDGPVNGGKASGGKASLDANQTLLLDYRNINFAGKEYITLQVCDLQGLCAQQQLTIDVVGEVLVYNGITPDGDGINDYMLIQFIDIIEGAKNNKVSIMNRWGDIVFEIDNYDNASRVFTGIGTNGKELPNGTYLYKVDLSSGKNYSGFVTLKR